MDSSFLSRAYLETLPSADLIALADDYGIDIPDNLNRRFIIGELLETAEEMNSGTPSSSVMQIQDGKNNGEGDLALPESYNETQITAMLRNPVWAFVFWDIKESDMHELRANSSFLSLLLRVSFFDDGETVKPVESFDVQVALSDREQYVLLPAGKQYVRIDLLSQYRGRQPQTLACSEKLELPHGCDELTDIQPGREIKLDPVLKLSGMEELLHAHYANHRQSFS